jgi:hypothetical protein
MERDMRLGRLGRAVSMGMMLGGLLFLAACPGDLEEAARQATEADDALPEETLEQCMEGCEQVATKEEEDCKAQLTEEEKVDKTSFDSVFLRCRTDAEGTRNGCQVECNMTARQRR